LANSDTSKKRADSTGGTRLRCPTCGKHFARTATKFPPFCCERCKQRDLGNWLDESYRIAGDPAPDPDSESE